MIIILKHAPLSYYKPILNYLKNIPNVNSILQTTKGRKGNFTEICLFGKTDSIPLTKLQKLPYVKQILQRKTSYPLIARPYGETQSFGFHYQGIDFFQDSFHFFAGLNTIDNKKNVEIVMQTLQKHGLTCTRMGAFKPRTNPYSFQGLGTKCLPYVFELACKYNIQVIAMEITHERQLYYLQKLLDRQGFSTGLMIQIGTRNIQNFELLKAIGQQKTYPILLKRGYGITLEESLNAAEYLAKSGNNHIIFCLRGMKSLFAPPKRNFIDFSYVSTIKQLSKMPVCIDPSHAVGNRYTDPDGIMDIYHTAAQGVICGANMLLIDIHPNPPIALVDARQTLSIRELPYFLDDMKIVRDAYYKRLEIAKKMTVENKLNSNNILF